MQRFVLQRLRDRPPRYEDTNHIQLEKPPPYQEAVTNCEVSSVLFYAINAPTCTLVFFHALCLNYGILRHIQCNSPIVIFSVDMKRTCNTLNRHTDCVFLCGLCSGFCDVVKSFLIFDLLLPSVFNLSNSPYYV